MRHCAVVGLALLLCATGGQPSAHAATAEERRLVCPVCSKLNKDSSYTVNASHTFVRGASNTLLGWTELIRLPAQEAKEGGSVAIGMIKGISEGAIRTGSGLGELFTFWLPKVPKDYIRFAHDCPVCMPQAPGTAPAAKPAPVSPARPKR